MGSERGTTLRVFGVVSDSIVDGPGLRLSVFTQGCPHRCEGCHNPSSHASGGGTEMEIEEIVRLAERNPLLSGVTLTGGEPLGQAGACLSLVRALPKSLTVWLYSGYTYEEIVSGGREDWLSLLDACDVLVDGRFRQDERSLELFYRGSRNQRVIDLRKTRERGSFVLWEAPE